MLLFTHILMWIFGYNCYPQRKYVEFKFSMITKNCNDKCNMVIQEFNMQIKKCTKNSYYKCRNNWSIHRKHETP